MLKNDKVEVEQAFIKASIDVYLSFQMSCFTKLYVEFNGSRYINNILKYTINAILAVCFFMHSQQRHNALAVISDAMIIGMSENSCTFVTNVRKLEQNKDILYQQKNQSIKLSLRVKLTKNVIVDLTFWYNLYALFDENVHLSEVVALIMWVH